MRRRTATILFAIVGVVFFLFIAVVAGGAWLFFSIFNSQTLDEAKATRTFEDARRRFTAIEPIIEIRNGMPVLVRRPPDGAPARELKTLHVLAWNPDDDRVISMELPMWLLRLSDGPIRLNEDRNRPSLSMSARDLDRYGPTLVLDHRSGRDEQVLVWTD
jgi:hypothetical protein